MISEQFKIPFKSKQHVTLRERIRARRSMSEEKMRNRFQDWRDMEDQAIFHIKESELDKLKKAKKKGTGEHDYTTLEIPYSYGMMMSAHTYWSTVFLGRDPIMQVSARHGEPQTSVMAMEALLSYQTHTGGAMMPYFIWLYDAAKYGLGIIGQYWEEEHEVVSRIVEEQKTFMGIPLEGKTVKRKIVERIPGYAGNKAFNVRPYEFYPDPRVPLARLQDGEFCGREVPVGWNSIARGAQEGRYFNVAELEKRLRATPQPDSDIAEFAERGSENIDWPDPIQGQSRHTQEMLGNEYVMLMEMYIELIPKDWGLGQSEFPEKWVFTLANDDVIIGARPLGEYHNNFPFYVLEQEIEGYGLFKRGMMEQMQPMNDTLSWLVNSHFFNVRAALNNQFVFDPSKINLQDMLSKDPGKMIRIRPDAYGTDVRTAVSQLPVADVTRTHLQDIIGVQQLMQQAVGVTENVMGLVNPGGRKSATEVRTSTSFSVNRMKTIAEYMSAMGWQPMAQDMIKSTQQHYDQEQKFRIVGTLPVSEPFMDVTPESITGFFDFVPVDGTLPVDRFAQANLWKEILLNIVNMPGIAQQYDIAGMFNFMASLGGIKNINQFRININPDAQMEDQVQRGNTVPVQGEGGVNLNEPGQVPNIGPTG